MLFDEARNDSRQGEHGSWSLERGRLTNGHLLLHFEISPPSHGLPVNAGPAVLFAGMEAFGGSGDVGMSEPMAALATTVMPACDDSDCRLSADIDLPTSEIADAIVRLEKRGDLMWVSVNLTLVRTFGAGQWLQVLPLQPAGDGALGARAGQLGAMERSRRMDPPIEIVANFDCAVPSGSLEPAEAAVVTDAPPTGEDELGTRAPSISAATPRDSSVRAPSSDPTSAIDGTAALLVGLVVVMLGGLALLLFVRRPRSRA